ncbi:sodium-dependent glucose transporter 1 isoform X2 [Mobula hypostoma]|uniref:sodium-dependent glucose transporter 1 isoform X2 n=1 Tax=Mobula hypostoma TaxID=723540 RepID=UPI002FC287E1
MRIVARSRSWSRSRSRGDARGRGSWWPRTAGLTSTRIGSISEMSGRAGGPSPAGKKQVRFARPLQQLAEEEDEEEDAAAEEEATTLCQKRPPAGLSLTRARRERDDVMGLEPRVREVRGGRWADTVLLCAAFLGLGMVIAVLGPTFKELAINVNRNISDISFIFVGRSLGYVGGSLVGGLLFDYMDHHLLIGISMLMTAVGLYIIPWSTKILLLMVLMSLIGISMGMLDTGGNLLILVTWGKNAGLHMQALHFSFALGAFLTPILAKPLLGNMQNISDRADDPIINTQIGPLNTVKMIIQSFSPLVWTYLIIASFVLFVSFSFFMIYLKSSPNRGRTDVASQEIPFARYHNAILLLLFLFFFWYVGAEVAYGAYIFTYAKDFVLMSDNQAAGLNSLFWGTFALVRGLAILFAACLYPGAMILLSIIGCTISSLILTLYNTKHIALWLGTGLYGASMATTFPSGIIWVKQYTEITGRSAGLFVFGAALGEMVVPAVVGYLQGISAINHYPILMLTALLTSTMTAILFPVMYKLATSPNGVKPQSEDQKALLGSGINEDDDCDDDAPEEWNDADFEVIEMCDVKDGTDKNPVGNASGKSKEQFSPEQMSFSSVPSPPYLGCSPKKRLLNLEREKND